MTLQKNFVYLYDDAIKESKNIHKSHKNTVNALSHLQLILDLKNKISSEKKIYAQTMPATWGLEKEGFPSTKSIFF